MKLRGIVAVMLLSAVSMCAQAAPAAQDAGKPAEHAACARDKSAKMEMDCCKKDKDGKMAMDCCKKDKDGKAMDCYKKGKCAREKTESEGKN
jgi:uncharacterized protein involved in copper resistance